MSKEEFKQASPVAIEDSFSRCDNLFDSISEPGAKPKYLASEWKAGYFEFYNCYDFGLDDSQNQNYKHKIVMPTHYPHFGSGFCLRKIAIIYL